MRVEVVFGRGARPHWTRPDEPATGTVVKACAETCSYCVLLDTLNIRAIYASSQVVPLERSLEASRHLLEAE